jgi:hypothetical protein
VPQTAGPSGEVPERDNHYIPPTNPDSFSQHSELNESYIFCLHERAAGVSRQVKTALEQEGYEGDIATLVVNANADERITRTARTQPRFLLFELPQPSKFSDAETRKLPFPAIERLLADPQLAGQLDDRRTGVLASCCRRA